MKLETKWRWFKRSTWLIGVASGCLIAWSIHQRDLALFVASFSLGVGGASLSVLIGFIDAFLEELK